LFIGLHVCLEQQELFNGGIRFWNKFGADHRQLKDEAAMTDAKEAEEKYQN
jgi:hypothetical protein